MVVTETLKSENIEIEIDEVQRLLGYKKGKAEKLILDKIESCIFEMKSKLSCRACYDRYELKVDGERLVFGNISTDSQKLKKNLSGCEEVIVFVATIGIEAERIIQKYSMVSPANAVVAQAVGAAYIEKFCDILCERFEEYEKKASRFIRPRFSPGYGDFPLEAQKRIFEALDCPRKIGVSLTESLLMVPSKSVSAVVGISSFDAHCNKEGCEICENKDCKYRRC